MSINRRKTINSGNRYAIAVFEFSIKAQPVSLILQHRIYES